MYLSVVDIPLNAASGKQRTSVPGVLPANQAFGLVSMDFPMGAKYSANKCAAHDEKKKTPRSLHADASPTFPGHGSGSEQDGHNLEVARTPVLALITCGAHSRQGPGQSVQHS